jgi:tetratricopeptide (TPR) repeat protein
VRSALHWWVESVQPLQGLDLAVSLCPFWMWRGMYAEGRHWLAVLLDAVNSLPPAFGRGSRATDDAADRALQARALHFLGVLSSRQGDHASARLAHEKSVQLWREANDVSEVAHSLSLVGFNAWLGGDAEEADRVLSESLALSRSASGTETVAMTLRNLGMVARSQGEYERAAHLFRESIAIAESLGQHGYHYARALCHLGRTLYLAGAVDHAQTCLREGLHVIAETGQAGNVLADGLEWLGAVVAANDHTARAVRLFGAADAQWRASGGTRYAPDQSAYERDFAPLRERLDERAFEHAWAVGLGMRADEAIAYALEQNT